MRQHFLADIILVLLALVLPVAAQTNSAKVRAASGVDLAQLAQMDALIEQAIARKELPGAVVLVGHKGNIVWRKAYGSRAVMPQRETMTADTIFDAASLTKVIATTTSILQLIERGQVRLSDNLAQFFPELKGNKTSENITVEQLLTHVGGFAPDFDLRERWTGHDEMLKRLAVEKLRQPPGAKFVYSDIGFIVLGEIVRRVSGLPLDEYARRNVFAPLGMRDSGFNPAATLRPRIAPTEDKKGQASYLGGQGVAPDANGAEILRGQVHDPTAYRMNGVAGHAGLFTTADDLARYCNMLLHGGVLNDVRVLGPLVIAEMMRPRAINEEGGARGLGWDIYTSFSSNRGELFPRGTFGHTGFTGTSIWIDPTSDTFVVFLSNRVHPNGKGDVGSLRGRIASIVAASVTDVPVEAVRAAAQAFSNEVFISTLKFVAQREAILKRAEQGANAQPANPSSSNLQNSNAQVLTGIDVLERDGFKQLQGMRVGLITNHTGRDRVGKSTIDVLYAAPNVKLVALFSPEHGIRGALDEKVGDSKDEKTGLPIYSLYGETRQPKPEQLQNLDALVYDIQDVGARFYTYISTLGLATEAAAKAGKPIIILDRPNPINGADTEGAVADADKLSFIAYHQIPVRHGMTVGELATLFNAERKFGADVRVVKMENWRRAMWFDETGLTWVNPSPNMRSLTEATLYPGIGLLETTNISVGRGTDTPFEIVGAPYIDGQKLAAALNTKNLAGVSFVPVRFTPNASVFKNEECGGINIIITDRTRFVPVRTGIEIALTLRALYLNEWKVDDYARLLVNADTLRRIKNGESLVAIEQTWTKGLNDFRASRDAFLLYR